MTEPLLRNAFFYLLRLLASLAVAVLVQDQI